MSEPFNRLVKLVARAFYDDITTKGDARPKSGRSDKRGIAVVVLDALTRRQWVREEDLMKDLKLHSKQLRRTLRFLEEEKLVARYHRKETAAKGGAKVKSHIHSYCCLDYAQVYDVVRYRIHRMRGKLKDELECKNTVQEYICPNCGRRYNALDASWLVSLEDDSFHCENCNGELVPAESDKFLAVQGGAEGDDNARRLRRAKLKDLLQKFDAQLKPLMEQINLVKHLDVPEFGTLQAWEARAVRAANGDSSPNDPNKSSQGYGGTPLPFLGDTKVEVVFSSAEGKQVDVKSESDGTTRKVLPPWMIKQGNEQQEEVNQESTIEDDKTSLQNEYIKEYYAALLKKQQLDEAAKSHQGLVLDGLSMVSSSNRQVGMKSKWEEDDGDDNLYWEGA